MDHTEFQLLVAQARHEASNPAFKVRSYRCTLMKLDKRQGVLVKANKKINCSQPYFPL